MSEYSLSMVAEHVFKLGLTLDRHLDQPMAGYLVGGYTSDVVVPLHVFVKFDVLRFLEAHEALFRQPGMFIEVSSANENQDVRVGLRMNMMFLADALIVGGMKGQSSVWDVLGEEEILL